MTVYVSLSQLVFLGVLGSGVHWIAARASITEPLWSRARGWLAGLLACAGCSGFWIGLGLGGLGLRPFCTSVAGVDIVASGILGTFVTPVFEGLLLWGLTASSIPGDTGDGEAGTDGEQP